MDMYDEGIESNAPPIEEVRKLVAPIESILVEAWLGAWNRWIKGPDAATNIFKRTRANNVFEYAMQIALPKMRDTGGVSVIERPDTAYFSVVSKVFLRMKKGNERGLGSNVTTQMNLALLECEDSLPLLPDVPAWRIECTYKLNMLETKIREIVILARHREHIFWQYTIYQADSQHDQPPVPRLPVSPPPPPSAKDVLSVPQSKQQSKEEK